MLFINSNNYHQAIQQYMKIENSGNNFNFYIHYKGLEKIANLKRDIMIIKNNQEDEIKNTSIEVKTLTGEIDVDMKLVQRSEYKFPNFNNIFNSQSDDIINISINKKDLIYNKIGFHYKKLMGCLRVLKSDIITLKIDKISNTNPIILTENFKRCLLMPVIIDE